MSYPKLKLTFEADKFPALSGLATGMTRMKGDATYVAGM